MLGWAAHKQRSARYELYDDCHRASEDVLFWDYLDTYLLWPELQQSCFVRFPAPSSGTWLLGTGWVAHKLLDRQE